MKNDYWLYQGIQYPNIIVRPEIEKPLSCLFDRCGWYPIWRRSATHRPARNLKLLPVTIFRGRIQPLQHVYWARTVPETDFTDSPSLIMAWYFPQVHSSTAFSFNNVTGIDTNFQEKKSMPARISTTLIIRHGRRRIVETLFDSREDAGL